MGWSGWSVQGRLNRPPSFPRRVGRPGERGVSSIRALEAQVARLEHELHTAHTILDVQGKVAGLLGLNLEHGTRS